VKQVALRLDDDLAAAIDKARGEVPRERWIRERSRDATTLKDLRGADVRSVHRDDSVIITGAEYLRKSRLASALEPLTADGGPDELPLDPRPRTVDRTASFRRATQSRAGKR
jgi:hypothetical protein